MTTAPLSIEQLMKLEPRLAELLAEARGYQRDTPPDFCASRAWYGTRERPGLRARLTRLIGWARSGSHPVLTRSAAYDVACDAVYGALPDCRGGCGCQDQVIEKWA